MALEQIMIIAVAAVCVFVAVLVLVLKMSSRRRGVPPGRGHRDRRLTAWAPRPAVYVPGDWEERAGSFGQDDEGARGGAPGYGRSPGYGPPPLWTDSPYDLPPRWRPDGRLGCSPVKAAHWPNGAGGCSDGAS